MNTRLLQTLKATAAAALVLGVCLPPAAQAIPPNQFAVEEASTVGTTSTSFVLVPGSSVTVNNGTTARNCVIQFSAEARNDEVGDGVAVALAIGGSTVGASACSGTGGPGLFHFAEAMDFETHTAVFVRPVASGISTIRACFILWDANENGLGTAILANRTLTVECRTQ
jgi:hypothetical protein